MKLDKPVFVVCDANGTFLGLFASYELADVVAEYSGAYIAETDEVQEVVPNEILLWNERRRSPSE